MSDLVTVDPTHVAADLVGEVRRHLVAGEEQVVVGMLAPIIAGLDAGTAPATPAGWELVSLYAVACFRAGDQAAAQRWAGMAHQALAACAGPASRPAVAAQQVLAVIEQHTGDDVAAVNTLEDLHRHSTRQHGAHAPGTLRAAADLAVALHRTRRCQAAHELLHDTVETYAACHGHDHTSIRMLTRLAVMVRDCDQFDHAHTLFAAARTLAAQRGDEALHVSIVGSARAGADPRHTCTYLTPAATGTGANTTAWPALPGPALRSGQAVGVAGAHRRTRRHSKTLFTRINLVGAEQAVLAAVRRSLGGLRQIMVTNLADPLATTTAVLHLAGSLGRARGGFVLAITTTDIGSQVEREPHGATITDLVANLPHFADGRGDVATLGTYVHAQPANRFDLLAIPPEGHTLGSAGFRAVHEVVSRYYKLIIVGAGSTQPGLWRASIDATDQVLIPLTPTPASVTGAMSVLDQLERTGRRQLAARSVLATQAPLSGLPDSTLFDEGLHNRCRAVLSAPADQPLLDGADDTRVSTDGWLTVAAAIVDGL